MATQAPAAYVAALLAAAAAELVLVEPVPTPDDCVRSAKVKKFNPKKTQSSKNEVVQVKFCLEKMFIKYY